MRPRKRLAIKEEGDDMSVKFRSGIALLALIFGGFAFFIACGSRSTRMVAKRYSPGFSLRHPEAWSARVIEKKYIWVGAAGEEGTSFIVVYPFFLRKKIDSISWLRQNIPLTPFFEHVSMEKMEQLRPFPDEAAARFLFKKGKLSYRGIALCSILEKSGILYALAAPEQTFENQRGQLLSILKSFRFENPEEGVIEPVTAPRTRYRSWQDPVENAFFMDIPEGWSAAGGTFRRAAVDLVHVLQVISPDQTMRIQFNDQDLPVFAIPTQMLLWSGFREGSWYSPGYGVNLLVKRYLPGHYFLMEYLNQKYRPGLADFSLVEQKERPDVVASLNRIWSQLGSTGVSFTLHAGDAAFRFSRDGKPFVGYGLAVTQVVQVIAMGGGGNWNVALLLIYLSPEEKANSVREIATHMFQSIRMNPAWVASQQQLTANVSQIVSQTGQEISRIIDESYWSRQGVLDDVHRKFSNYILGITDVVDPETKETWKVEAGHNYYWRKAHTNVIVGSQTPERPDIDFSLLREF